MDSIALLLERRQRALRLNLKIEVVTVSYQIPSMHRLVSVAHIYQAKMNSRIVDFQNSQPARQVVLTVGRRRKRQQLREGGS
ncbi:unnamed protein product [Strongylus vulgaris]|uniref:Uncharacterized protein n=1 Tax=Strongylus vulgaris TaxID=40348 RepID=A0A3P7KJZ9_STRVU|nr:unnamed protein product [Strongylus vulgaris]